MTKRCICFVSFILSLSILFHAATYFADSRLFSKKQALSFPPRKADDSTIPDNSTDRLFWFIQVGAANFNTIFLAFRPSFESF